MNKTVLIAESDKGFQRMKKWLDGYDECVLKGSYTAVEAITKVNWENINNVHIDYSILHWTVLAEMLLKMNPSLEITFFDAEMNGYNDVQPCANAYLIKRMSVNELAKNASTKISDRSQRKSHMLEINCFGGLSIFLNNQPIVFRTQKAEEIIAFLIHNGRNPVYRDMIIDSLWPEMDADKGCNNFHVNIYNIRNTLKEYGLEDLILQSKGSYYINAKIIDCDLWRFNDMVQTLKEMKYQSKELLESSSEIYKGQYFGVNAYPWTREMQLKYDRIFEEIQFRLYDIYNKEEQFKKAAQAMKSLITIDPISVDANEKCISALLNMYDMRAAQKCYYDFEKNHREEVGGKIPQKMQDLKKSLSAAAAHRYAL